MFEDPRPDELLGLRVLERALDDRIWLPIENDTAEIKNYIQS